MDRQRPLRVRGRRVRSRIEDLPGGSQHGESAGMEGLGVKIEYSISAVTGEAHECRVLG